MQCTGVLSCFSWGKRAAMVRRYPAFFCCFFLLLFFLLLCAVFSCFHTTSIAANPPGFPGNLLHFETCPGIPDVKKQSRILNFVRKNPKNNNKQIGIISSTLSGIAVTSHTFALFVFYFLPRMILI